MQAGEWPRFCPHRLPGGAAVNDKPRQKFKVGDTVKPRYPDALSPVMPVGEVIKVAPFGLGQVIMIRGASKWHLSGEYVLSEVGSGHQ